MSRIAPHTCDRCDVQLTPYNRIVVPVDHPSKYIDLCLTCWDLVSVEYSRVRTAYTRRSTILQEVFEERDRQEELCAAGKFSLTCASTNLPIGGKLCVLAEEFGEVAKESCQLYDPRPGDNQAAAIARLRTELVQLAAVAAAWIESIDAEEKEAS